MKLSSAQNFNSLRLQSVWDQTKLKICVQKLLAYEIKQVRTKILLYKYEHSLHAQHDREKLLTKIIAIFLESDWNSDSYNEVSVYCKSRQSVTV